MACIMVSPALLLCVLLVSIQLHDSLGNTQMPKVFVDVESIKLVDPLRTGFQIVLQEHFLHHYLNPTKLPTIFVSALPLGQDAPGARRMMYREDIQDSAIQIQGLQERAWYYVCVEFENVVRRHARGNTSTSCVMARTLDEFGKRADGTVRDIQVSQLGNDFAEFQLAVDAEFSVQLTIFLESGSCPVHIYVISNPKTLRVRFQSLSPGFNYGRLCVREQPLVQLYSMMGRDIHASKETCYFDDLKTHSEFSENSYVVDDQQSLKRDSQTDKQKLQKRPVAANLKMSSSSSASGSRTHDLSGPSMATYHIVIFSLITCVIGNVLLPVIPLAYLITCCDSKDDVSKDSAEINKIQYSQEKNGCRFKGGNLNASSATDGSSHFPESVQPPAMVLNNSSCH